MGRIGAWDFNFPLFNKNNEIIGFGHQTIPVYSKRQFNKIVNDFIREYGSVGYSRSAV